MEYVKKKSEEEKSELPTKCVQLKLRARDGKISHQEAIEKAEKEFKIYREKEMKELQSDFDLLMKLLPNNINK